MAIGKLALRGLVGGLFIGHGTQKLKGWFDGPGIEGTSQMMSSLGLEPARRNALAAGTAETAGGAALALGLATPLASATLIGTMITAIRKLHLANGPWAANGGWEYNAVLIAALIALADEGPGALSVDALRGKDRSGFLAALLALGLGVAASTAVIEAGARAAASTSDDDHAPFGDTAGDPVTES